MIKFKNLLNEIEPRDTFTTSLSGENPEEQSKSWVVQYHPVNKLTRELETLKVNFEHALKHNPNDTKLLEYYEHYKSFKKSLNTYLNKQYPQ